MYPLSCYAGYAMPIRTGKFEIVAVGFSLEDSSAAYELSIWDSPDNAVINSADETSTSDSRRIFHCNGNADAGPSPFYSFPEPLKTRMGISVGDGANIDPGELYVYVR